MDTETAKKKLTSLLSVDYWYEKNNKEIEQILNTEAGMAAAVKYLTPYYFYQLVEKFNISDKIVAKRLNAQKNILKNIDKNSLPKVKCALCELLFRDNVKNVKIKLETIKERADADIKYREQLGKMYDLICQLLDFINLPNSASKEEIKEKVEVLLYLANTYQKDNIKFYQIFDKIYADLHDKFSTEVEDRVTPFETLIDKVEPKVLTTKTGKTVEFYHLKKQTKNQEGFVLLARLSRIRPYMKEDGAKEKYGAIMGSYSYLSYSLFSESVKKPYGGKDANGVVFGFNGTNGNYLISGNTKDGNTNQIALSRSLVMYKQEYLPVDLFIEKTGNKGKWNELVIETKNGCKPDYIITYHETPTEDEIEIAAAFGIPIVHIDEKIYEDAPSFETINSEDINNDAFDIFTFCMEEPLDLELDSGMLDNPDAVK